VFDSSLRTTIDPYLNKLADQLGKIGVKPNHISVYGFVVGIVGCIAIGMASYMFGLFLILLNRLCDGVDGAVARYNQEQGEKPNAYGAYLDTVLEMLLFGAFVFLFVLGQPHHATGGVFILFSFLGLFTTSLGSYVVGNNNIKRPFYHPVNLVQRTEIVGFIILSCFYPDAFSAIAVLFGVLCWFTTISRIWFAYRDFKKKNQPSPSDVS
jgi:phosphatidylglycerophosphate synthase